MRQFWRMLFLTLTLTALLAGCAGGAEQEGEVSLEVPALSGEVQPEEPDADAPQEGPDTEAARKMRSRHRKNLLPSRRNRARKLLSVRKKQLQRRKKLPPKHRRSRRAKSGISASKTVPERSSFR